MVKRCVNIQEWFVVISLRVFAVSAAVFHEGVGCQSLYAFIVSFGGVGVRGRPLDLIVVWSLCPFRSLWEEAF